MAAFPFALTTAHVTNRSRGRAYFLVDGRGTVRWTCRPDRFLTRLTPAEMLAALDQHVQAE